MRLIRLTELKRDTDDSVLEKDILINPEGIATVEEMKMPHEAIPILGANHSGRLARGITMRSGQRMMVKESLDEIAAICSPAQRCRMCGAERGSEDANRDHACSFV